MPTKYDVFAKVIEKAPCKQNGLEFNTPVYAHLSKLTEEGFIEKTEKGYEPIKNKKTIVIFEIMKKSLKTGLDYNLILSDKFIEVISTIKDSAPLLLPKALQDNPSASRIIKYLEKNQFVLVYSKKPKLGVLLNHSIFTSISGVHSVDLSFTEIFETQRVIEKKLLANPKRQTSTYDRKYFENITGSAQLEGSTVTLGETIDMLRENIYPDKRHEDVQMVKNLDEATRYALDDIDEPLTPEHIKKINEKVLFSLDRRAGKFKTAQNKIAGNPAFKTTLPEFVEVEILKYCDFFNYIDTREKCVHFLGEAHNRIHRIHPFPDGNSRTTRIVINRLLAKFDLPLFTLKVGSFEKYMSLTKLADKRYDKELQNFICHILMHEFLINEDKL